MTGKNLRSAGMDLIQKLVEHGQAATASRLADPEENSNACGHEERGTRDDFQQRESRPNGVHQIEVHKLRGIARRFMAFTTENPASPMPRHFHG